MKFVIIGLSLSSSWGNGHATTYRALLKGLSYDEHDILFLEREESWYASNRDLPDPEFCKLRFYSSTPELKTKFEREVTDADMVIVGSYVREGVDIGNWVVQKARGIKAFYDIDTPVTLSKLENKDFEYLNPDLISRYDMYLSFTGGPVLRQIEKRYHSPMVRPLYCAVDPHHYFPVEFDKKWQMGYLGTYSEDRQPALNELMNETASRLRDEKFVVAGPQFPQDLPWSKNVERMEHLPPGRHLYFYNMQRFTLNVTRPDMVNTGFSPSVRLFEAAACGVPIISDYWEGIETFFEPGHEIFIARNATDIVQFFYGVPPDERKWVGYRALQKIFKHHTAGKRAQDLLKYIQELKQIDTPVIKDPFNVS